MSNNFYRNAEGYYDPTAGAVLAGISRKERSDRRKARRRRNARARKQAAQTAAVRSETEKGNFETVSGSVIMDADTQSCSQVAETDVDGRLESTTANQRDSHGTSDGDEDKGGCDGTI